MKSTIITCFLSLVAGICLANLVHTWRVNSTIRIQAATIKQQQRTIECYKKLYAKTKKQ